LHFYAWLELGIGLYAVVFPRYYELLHDAYVALVRRIEPGGGVLLAMKFAAACVAILPPTILMGATLPALTKFVTRSLSELRGKVAALYAINSTGAVIGVVLADWWWIPALGLEAVVQAGAALSLLVGLIAFVVSYRIDEQASGEPVAAGDATRSNAISEPEVERFTPLELRLALIGIGVSGFVAMLYEVTWTRVLGLALASSTHAYSLMLATFIAGIAVGGWIIYRWKRQANTLAAFAWAELALAGTLFVSLFFYDLLPYWFVRLAALLARRPEAYPVYELIQALICFAVMFVPAICLGMTLPLVSRVATVELARTGRSVGRVFAVNTLGTVLGAALSGLVLLPVMGLARTIALGVVLNAMVGLAILSWPRPGRRKLFLSFGPGVALLVVWLVGAVLTQRWQRAFDAGVWRLPEAPTSIAEFRKTVGDLDVVFHRDGAGSSVAVIRWKEPGKPDYLTLKVNGKADASSGTDMATQLLAGHIPMMLRPQSAEALVVGAGSGVTAGALMQHSSIQRVDLVEISPEVVEAARTWFAPFNQQVFDDPRLHVAVEDAKSFLKATPRRYDVIVTEPSNPWMAGVAAVFSREYYEDCRARLKPDGLIAQWLQAYESDDATLDVVVGTVGSIFPYLSLWQTGSGDLLLVGAVSPVKFDLEAVAARFAEPKVAADLSRVGLTRVSTLLALQHLAFGDATFLPEPGTRLHSDFHPVLEYAAQRAFFVRGNALRFRRVSELFSTRPRTLLGEYLQAHPLTAADCEAMANFFYSRQFPGNDVLRTVLYRWLREHPEGTAPLKMLVTLAGLEPAQDSEMARLARRREFQDVEYLRDVGVLRQYAGLLLLMHRTQRSAVNPPPTADLERVLRALVELDEPNLREHRMHLAELAWDRGDDDACLKLGGEALNPSPLYGPPGKAQDPMAGRAVLARMLDAHLRRGDRTNAVQLVFDAQRQGYLDPSSATRNLRLEVMARRVAAEMEVVGERR
jgi:predicted membrane-bound spermidine synthase